MLACAYGRDSPLTPALHMPSLLLDHARQREIAPQKLLRGTGLAERDFTAALALTPVQQFAMLANLQQAGGEADLAYQFNSAWKGYGTLAYVRGSNDTDDKPLAQQPPLELRVGLSYDDKTYSVGALARLVSAQDRYDVGSGNIVSNGKDLGRSGGFGVFSLNAGYRPNKKALLSAGVDNLFDKVYAEHLSKGGSDIAGYLGASTLRINEPGRTFWLKAQIALD